MPFDGVLTVGIADHGKPPFSASRLRTPAQRLPIRRRTSRRLRPQARAPPTPSHKRIEDRCLHAVETPSGRALSRAASRWRASRPVTSAPSAASKADTGESTARPENAAADPSILRRETNVSSICLSHTKVLGTKNASFVSSLRLSRVRLAICSSFRQGNGYATSSD
jgi:hypothetical protein